MRQFFQPEIAVAAFDDLSREGGLLSYLSLVLVCYLSQGFAGRSKVSESAIATSKISRKITEKRQKVR